MTSFSAPSLAPLGAESFAGGSFPPQGASSEATKCEANAIEPYRSFGGGLK